MYLVLDFVDRFDSPIVAMGLMREVSASGRRGLSHAELAEASLHVEQATMVFLNRTLLNQVSIHGKVWSMYLNYYD